LDAPNEQIAVTVRDDILALKSRIGESIVGQDEMVERLVLGLLSNGNLLVEGLPGLAKTRAIKSLSKNLDAQFSRIQFTPDLLPSDITGSEVYFSSGGKGEFKFQQGPIFANLVLADEVNRAPAKVQAALLEAMEERQVTVAGTTHKLPPLFIVMATQNPIEQEGTYPLPEAQLDRFLLHAQVNYPSDNQEKAVIRMVRGEEGPDHRKQAAGPVEAVSQEAILAARAEIAAMHVAEPIDDYIVALVCATRRPADYDKDLGRWIEIGGSPRASIGLDRAARARAWLAGRDHVEPDDVRDVAPDVLRHRLSLSYEAAADKITPGAVIEKLLTVVAVA
jgi:MoxR-like ATPase